MCKSNSKKLGHVIRDVFIGTTGIRGSQCHCFMNIAYGYAKLNNVSGAEECYLHALLAAEDTGNKQVHYLHWNIYYTLLYIL